MVDAPQPRQALIAGVTVGAVILVAIVAAGLPLDPAEPTGEADEQQMYPVEQLACPSWATEPAVRVGAILVLGVLGLLARRRGVRVAMPIVLALPVLVGWLGLCPPVTVSVPGIAIPGVPGLPVPGSTVLIAGVVVAGILWAFSLGWNLWQLDLFTHVGVEPVPTEPEHDRPELARIGARAGEAARRIESHGRADNEVYAAWAGMIRLVNVDDPETCTPREFATAAVEAGMNPEHVEELTTLFELVRYGNRSPKSYEDRAVDVLRAIESTYATEADE